MNIAVRSINKIVLPVTGLISFCCPNSLSLLSAAILHINPATIITADTDTISGIAYLLSLRPSCAIVVPSPSIVPTPPLIVAESNNPTSAITTSEKYSPIDIIAPPNRIFRTTSIFCTVVSIIPSLNKYGAPIRVTAQTKINEKLYIQNTIPEIGYPFKILTICIQLPHIAAASRVRIIATSFVKYDISSPPNLYTSHNII